MKFKDIKVGDTVYILKDVSSEYPVYLTNGFWIPIIVSDVSDLTFSANLNEFGKKDGIGNTKNSHEQVFNLGDQCGFNKFVTDQTEDYNQREYQISDFYKAKNALAQIRLHINSFNCTQQVSILLLKALECIKK